MGKRSDFERKGMDFYPTPMDAVKPLINWLRRNATFCEPCAGEGHLVRHLETLGHQCVSKFDAQPRSSDIRQQDASWITSEDINKADLIITNPPWDRPPLHQIIERCATLAPTWLLFDADWMHTRQAAPFLLMCEEIVSVGRVKWIEGSSMAGKDNCCWYLFDASFHGFPKFYGKQ